MGRMGAVTAPVIMGAAIYPSQSQGGIPSVDGDAWGLPEFLGLNPRGDAGLSSGKGVCFGSSFRWRDESAAGGVAGMQSIGSDWAEHSPSAGETTGDDEGDEE